MKKIVKIGAILVAITIIAGVSAYMYMNKPHPDYAILKADFVIDAKTFYEEFKNNPVSASQKYNGKIIEIYGKPNSVEKADTMLIVVYAFEEGVFGAEGIRCSVLPGYQENLTENNLTGSFSIKGFCTGFNDTDVILEKCSVN